MPVHRSVRIALRLPQTGGYDIPAARLERDINLGTELVHKNQIIYLREN